MDCRKSLLTSNFQEWTSFVLLASLHWQCHCLCHNPQVRVNADVKIKQAHALSFLGFPGAMDYQGLQDRRAIKVQ
ncbi:hypothetical protein lerEdw1_013906 [Lerista edwardsae]|nr:hypothetical protein lerEdw1_013906 [Lerista edwardsae]